jgi:hypothetical protein
VTDQELVLDAVKKLNLIVSEYLRPGPSIDARRTLDVLILILQDEALADAMAQLEALEALRNSNGTAH